MAGPSISRLLRQTTSRQRRSVSQKRSMSEVPEALGCRNRRAIGLASLRWKAREGDADGIHGGGTVKSSAAVLGCASFAALGPRNATNGAGKMRNSAHGTSCCSATGGSQLCAKSRMIQSGRRPWPSPPAAQASARKEAAGPARPSKASLRSSTLSGGTSAVDSAPSGNRRPEPGDVPRGGDEGDEVPAPRQLLGELEERHDVAEGEPWEHHDVKRWSLLGFGHGWCSFEDLDEAIESWTWRSRSFIAFEYKYDAIGLLV